MLGSRLRAVTPVRTRGQAVEERQLKRHVIGEAQRVAHLGGFRQGWAGWAWGVLTDVSSWRRMASHHVCASAHHHELSRARHE